MERLNSFSMSGFWVVAKTRPLKELWAAENVARQGFQYYLPLTPPPAQKKPSKSPPKPQCLFPRYLFVWTEGRWRSLLGTFGIAGLVMQGEKPAIMPEKAVEQIKAREGAEGLVRLPNASKARFQPGEPVRINGGVFSGYTAIVDDTPDPERVRILLDYLGRRTKVLLGEDVLEPL